MGASVEGTFRKEGMVREERREGGREWKIRNLYWSFIPNPAVAVCSRTPVQLKPDAAIE